MLYLTWTWILFEIYLKYDWMKKFDWILPHATQTFSIKRLNQVGVIFKVDYYDYSMPKYKSSHNLQMFFQRLIFIIINLCKTINIRN